MPKSFVVLLTVLVCCASVAGPVGSQAPGQRPALSGTLNLLCTPQIVWCEGMKEAFQTVYPQVTVEFVRLSSGEALTRLRNERANPQFDLWWGGPIDSFIAAKAEGLLEAYNSPQLARLIDPKLMQDPENYWAGIYVGSLGFASNKQFLDKHGLQAPQSWDDLLNPAFKGQLVIAHPASSGTAYTALVTVLQLKGEAQGWDYWRRFHTNVWQYTKSGAAPAQHVGQGEAAVGVVFSHDTVAQMDKGLPIVLSFPQEGTGWEIGGMALLKGAKHVEVAKAWFDWALEPTTQELGAKYAAYQAPTVQGARAPKPELLGVHLINYDFAYAGKHKKAFIDKFTNEITVTQK